MEVMNWGYSSKLIVICSFVMLFFSLSGCINDNGGDGGSEEDWREWPIVQSSVERESGHCNEGESEIEEFDIYDYYVTKIYIELYWEDEPNITTGRTNVNQPDSFNITIFTPWNETINSDVIFNPIGGIGHILETIEVPEEGIVNNTANGEWIVYIHCTECGNFESEFGSIGFTDNGNSWDLSYYYEYHSNE